MRAGDGGTLRVALLLHSYGSPPGAAESRHVRQLARALRDAGHHPLVISSHRGRTRRVDEDGIPVVWTARAPEALLAWRGFVTPLTHVPLGVRVLLGEGCDVAHAFSAPDALTALVWRRVAHRPVVFTYSQPVGREWLADRRQRLWLTRRAVETSEAVVAASEQVRESLWRWLAAEAVGIDPGDAAGHEQLYRKLLGGP